MKEIEKGIEQAGVFLFLLSPESARSKYCRQEIEYAVKNGKRLIPVVVQDVSPEQVPSELCSLNWIFFRENDDFSISLEKLITAVKTDYDWVRAQRDMQIKALEWERGRRDKSFLLRGTELQLAELQFRINASKEPCPTDLQREYVLKSRQAVVRQQRIVASIGIGIGLVLAVLAIFGWITAGNEKNARATADSSRLTAVFNANYALTQEAKANIERMRADNSATKATVNEQEAIRQSEIAFSRQLAAQARAYMGARFGLALLLAVEASRGTSDGQFSLSNLLLAEPQLVRIASSPKGYIWNQGESGEIKKLLLSPDGNQLAAQSFEDAMFWDLSTKKNNELDPGLFQEYATNWTEYQTIPPAPQDVFKTINIKSLTGPTSAVSNRVAYSACRTYTSGGGAPGCASLIYVFAPGSEHLINPLASCSINKKPLNFQIELEGGLYHISNFQDKAIKPANFDLYSVTLDNEASLYGSTLVDAIYYPQTKYLATAAGFGRHYSNLALTVWNLTDKKPILELFRKYGVTSGVQLDFSNSGTSLDVCGGLSDIQIDIDPISWETQACEIAGRNFTQTEWQYFFGDKPYQSTCPQWPAGT